MDHNKISSSTRRRNIHSTLSTATLLVLLLLLFKEDKVTIRNIMSTSSSRFFVKAWTSGSNSNYYKKSSFYRTTCCRILNNMNHNNRFISCKIMPRTVLNVKIDDSSISSSSNSKNVLTTNNTTEIKSNNNILFSLPNIFRMFNRRFGRNKDKLRNYSSSSANSDDYAKTTSSLSNQKEEEGLVVVEKSGLPTTTVVTNNNNDKTFFLNVNEKVKEIQSSNITLDPRTIFFPNGTTTSLVDDLVTNNNDNQNKEELSESSLELFPKEMFNEYKEAIHNLLEINRGLKREDPKDIDIVLSWILNPSRTTNINLTTLQSSNTITTEEDFRKDLNEQHALFLKENTFTMEHYQLATRILNSLGDYCAKRMLLQPIIIGWEKVKESGMILREPAMNTYLYIVGNSILPSSIQNLTSIDDDDDDDDVLSKDKSFGDDIIGEVALFHDLLYKPTENSITLRIKTFVSKNQIHDAESLLLSYAQENGQLRLRSYFPVLNAYCEIGDCVSAFRIFYKMRKSVGVKLEPENYVLFLSTLVENGVFT